MSYLTPEEQRRQAMGLNADPEDMRFGGGGAAGAAATPGAAGGAGAAGAAAGGASAMPWVNAIAGELAKRQQEEDQRRQAKADLASQYASTQGNFPQYGYEGAKKNAAINNAQGGMGIGRFARGLMGRFRI